MNGEDGADEAGPDTSSGDTSTDDGTHGEESVAIRPGEGIGPVNLGATYGDLRAAIGEAANPFPSNRIVVAVYDTPAVEVVFATPDNVLVDDAVVIAVGTRSSGDFTGDVTPGLTRAEVETRLGVAPDLATDDQYAFYPSGITLRYIDERVFSVGVVPPYTLAPDPPPMQPAAGGA